MSEAMSKVAAIMQTSPFADSQLEEYVDLRQAWTEFSAFEARLLLLEEMLKPTKVQADSWSIAVGQ